MSRRKTQPASRRIFLYLLIAISIAIGCSILAPSGSVDFDPMTYGGRTQMGSNIALMLKADGGEIEGKGCHRFSSGKRNDVYLKGSISSELRFEVREFLRSDSSFFGMITGEIIEDGEVLDGIWTNKDDQCHP